MEMETNFLNSLNVEVNGRDIRVNATDVISVQDDTSTQIIDFVLDKNEISYDLSLLTAFIVYQPASASGARFEICKKTVEDSNIIVRWIIKKEATFSTGKLRFQLVFTDGPNPGVESAHRWATKIVTVTIPETLTTGQYAVPTEPIIEQMMEIAASVVEAGDKVSRAEEAAISAEEAAARAENAADSIQEAVDANTAAQEAKNAAVSASQNAQLAADTVQAIVANNEAYTKQECDYKYTVAPRKEATSDTGTMELTDADNGLAGVSMKGNSFQYESMGKNLLDTSSPVLVNSENCKISNSGNVIEVTGKKAYSYVKFDLYNILKVGESYYIVVDSMQSTASKQFGVQVIVTYNDNTPASYYVLYSGNNKVQFTVPHNIKTIVLGAYAILSSEESSTSITSTYTGLRIVKAEDQDAPWEPYSGGETGPNPDYPFPVQSVGDIPKDSNGVEIRNLLDEEILKSSEQGSDLSGDASFAVFDSISFNPGTYLIKTILHGKKVISTGGAGLIFCIDKSNSSYKTLINISGDTMEEDTITVNTGQKGYLAIRKTTSIKDICNNYNIMITTASEIDEYRPYIGENNGLIKIESQGKNLLDLEIQSSVEMANIIDCVSNNVMCRINNSYFSSINPSNINEIIEKNKGKVLVFSTSNDIKNDSTMSITIFGEYSDGSKFKENQSSANKNNIEMLIPDELIQCNGVSLRFNRKSSIHSDMSTVYKNLMLYIKEDGADATYTPYQHSITWVTLKEPLRKIGDVADEILKDGTVVQRIGSVSYKELGGKTWDTDELFLKNNLCYAYPYNITPTLNSISLSNYLIHNAKFFEKECIYTTSSFLFFLKLERLGLSDSSTKQEVVAAIKNYVSKIDDGYVNYQLKTPITYTIPRILVETYDPTTNITVQSEIKPEMTVDYKIAISSILRRLESLEQIQVNAL